MDKLALHFPFVEAKMSDTFKFDEAKYNRARQFTTNVGTIIILAVTLLSAVSSFQVYRPGFEDLGPVASAALAVVAVAVVEGTFCWLLYGYNSAFTGSGERFFAFWGMWVLVGTMLLNIVSHAMMAKRIELAAFQRQWVSWGAVSVFIFVLVLVLCVKLSDPFIRFITLELRYRGKKHDTILTAKAQGLNSAAVSEALAVRTERESGVLVAEILGDNNGPKP
jgi:hypothetical protein